MLIQIQLLLGTSGEFIIEIDATGTETLLTYNTKITFTNKPDNLKFYKDSEKNQELIVEKDKYLILDGFISLEDNKKRDIPIYWNWEFETGLSEKDKEENDIIDSNFIGKNMSMKIDVKGMQVSSNPYTDKVASVTCNGEIMYFASVQEAIQAVGENNGAVVSILENNIEDELVIGEHQDLVIDLNSKNLNVKINNYGKVDIRGNGNIYGKKGSGIAIANCGGIMNIYSNGTIKREVETTTDVIAIHNDSMGILNIYGNLEIIGLNPGTGTGRGINNNKGIINIYNGNISGKTFGVVNQTNAEINVYNNTIIRKGLLNSVSTNEYAVINVYGGTIYDGLFTVKPGKGKVFDYR